MGPGRHKARNLFSSSLPEEQQQREIPFENCTRRCPWVWLRACVTASDQSVIGDYRCQGGKPENAAKDDAWAAWPGSCLLPASQISHWGCAGCGRGVCFIHANKVTTYRIFMYVVLPPLVGGKRFIKLRSSGIQHWGEYSGGNLSQRLLFWVDSDVLSNSAALLILCSSFEGVTVSIWHLEGCGLSEIRGRHVRAVVSFSANPTPCTAEPRQSGRRAGRFGDQSWVTREASGSERQRGAGRVGDSCLHVPLVVLCSVSSWDRHTVRKQSSSFLYSLQPLVLH